MKKHSVSNRLATKDTMSGLSLLDDKIVVFSIVRIVLFNTAQHTKGIFEGFLKPSLGFPGLRYSERGVKEL